MNRRKRFVIKGCQILTMVQGEQPFLGDLLIENGYITRIAASIDQQVDQVIDGKDKVAMPGLINAHNHAGMSLLRGFSDDLKLMDWLDKKCFPPKLG